MPGRETCRVGGEADVMVEMGDTPVDAVWRTKARDRPRAEGTLLYW